MAGIRCDTRYGLMGRIDGKILIVFVAYIYNYTYVNRNLELHYTIHEEMS